MQYIFPQWLSFAKYFSRLSFRLLDGFFCYAYNGLLFILKREINLLYVTTWMSLEDLMLSEISWTQKAEPA